MNAEGLSQFLPSATAGWSRQVDTDFSKTLGGVDGGARNEGGGENLKITLLADNPMVASMDGLFGGAVFCGEDGADRPREVYRAGQRLVHWAH